MKRCVYPQDNIKIPLLYTLYNTLPAIYLVKNTKKELKSTIIFVLINIMVIFLIYFGKFLKNYFSDVKYFWIGLVIYFILTFLLTILNHRINFKVLRIATLILSFPISLIYVLVAILIPVLITQIYLILYFILSFILPYLLYTLDIKYSFLSLQIQTWIYIISTTGVIIAIIFNKQIDYLTFKIVPFTSLKKEKKKRSNLVELCNYIVSSSNIKLVIYSLYFIALIITNFLNFQDSSFFSTPDIDKAILQSFITFLAFERLTTNLELSEFRPSQLISILQSAINKEIEEITGRK